MVESCKILKSRKCSCVQGALNGNRSTVYRVQGIGSRVTKPASQNCFTFFTPPPPPRQEKKQKVNPKPCPRAPGKRRTERDGADGPVRELEGMGFSGFLRFRV